MLGAILFSIYMLHLSSIFRKFNISFHLYADNTQIYLQWKLSHYFFTKTTVQLPHWAWMAPNVQNFNEDKTKVNFWTHFKLQSFSFKSGQFGAICSQEEQESTTGKRFLPGSAPSMTSDMQEHKGMNGSFLKAAVFCFGYLKVTTIISIYHV